MLATVVLEGVNGYDFTAGMLAWGAHAAAAGRTAGQGALGPVEAFGLDALEEGARSAGIARRDRTGAPAHGAMHRQLGGHRSIRGPDRHKFGRAPSFKWTCKGIGTSRQAGRGLETCAECGRAFVVPVALLDLVDEGLYLLALHCKNCDRLAVGVHEDAELELLERRNDAAAAEIEAALEIARDLALHRRPRRLQPGARGGPRAARGLLGPPGLDEGAIPPAWLAAGGAEVRHQAASSSHGGDVALSVDAWLLQRQSSGRRQRPASTGFWAM